MEQENDLVYLDRRATEERRAANRTGNRIVRDVHLEFASAYEFRLHLLRKDAELAAASTRSRSYVPAAARHEALSIVAAEQGEAIPQHVPFMIGRSA